VQNTARLRKEREDIFVSLRGVVQLVERLPVRQEVANSSLVAPANFKLDSGTS
jgi:hypothetical protein